MHISPHHSVLLKNQVLNHCTIVLQMHMSQFNLVYNMDIRVALDLYVTNTTVITTPEHKLL